MAVTGNKVELGQMNLATLKRYDSDAVSIIDKATQVALYKYSLDLSEWEKTDIQGTFFIYQRSGQPSHSCLVLNRLNINNLTQPLTSDLEFRCQTPFLLYRNGKGEIFGLWFFYDKECTRLSSRMEALCSSAENPPGVAADAGADKKQQQKERKHKSRPVDLLSLITANSNEKSTAAARADSSQSSVPASVGHGGRAAGPASNPVTADSSGTITVHDLFAKASQMGQATVGKPSDRTMSVSEVEGSMTHRLPLQKLLSHPPPTHPPMSGPPHLAPSLPSHLQSPLPLQPPTSLPPRIQTSVPPPEHHEKSDINRIHELFSGGLQQQRLQSAPPTEAVSASTSTEVARGGASHDQINCSSKPSHTESYNPISLMSPMMFTAPTSTSGGIQAPADQGACASNLEPVSDMDNGADSGPEPLTARQLAQALTHMLKNDEDFVEKLHQAYVQSLSSRYKWS